MGETTDLSSTWEKLSAGQGQTRLQSRGVSNLSLEISDQDWETLIQMRSRKI